MLRDKNLVPLSRQHQHALALCVRVERALRARDADQAGWQAEIQQHFEQEIGMHFAAEEAALFPAAARFPEVKPLVDELLAEHGVLRDYFARAAARSLDRAGLRKFADKLSAHIRKEERQLFEAIQKLMKVEDLAKLGAALEDALKNAPQSCLLPGAATRLRPGE